MWLPSRVEEAVQFKEHGIALRLRTMEQQSWLYISWSPASAHIGMSSEIPPRGDVAETYSFGKILHKSLKSLVLESIQVPERFERRADLGFAPRLGDDLMYLLHIEMMGKYSNVVLTDATDKSVVAAAHQVGSKMTSLRSLKVGQQYLPPPPPPGIPPDSIKSWEEMKDVLRSKALRNSLQSNMVAVFQGISPATARDLCHAADISPEIPVEEIKDTEWQAVFKHLGKWVQSSQTGAFSLYAMDAGYFLKPIDDGRTECSDLKQLSALSFFWDYYGGKEGKDEIGRLKQRLNRIVSNSQLRLLRKVESLRAQAKDPSEHEATSKIADLVMSNLHNIKPDMRSIEVTDWDTGQPLVIALDQNKTPIEFAEGLYAKARKQRRAVQQVSPLIEAAIKQHEYLAELAIMIEQLGDGDEVYEDYQALKQIEEELAGNGFLKPIAKKGAAIKSSSKGPRPGKRSRQAMVEKYREFNSPSNFLVLVGRNSKQNDEITLKISNNNDIWMHARGLPGAHVLLRVPPGQECTDEDIQFAADLAAFYSKGRTESKLEVTCAKPEDITKPRGAKPGQVLVRKEWVTTGRPHRCLPRVNEGE